MIDQVKIVHISVTLKNHGNQKAFFIYSNKFV